MKRLKLRPRQDALPNEVRRHSFGWTRIVYFAILLVGFGWVADLFFGSYFYLKSEGMVVAPSAVLATEYPATIRGIEVREGQSVGKGEMIAKISSQQLNESVARLTSEVATLRAREAELRIQAQRNSSLLSLARYRSDVAKETRAKYETLQKDGILPADKRTAAIESEYRGQFDMQTLTAEVDAVRQELEKLGPAVTRAEDALNTLEDMYGAGAMLSPIDGVVGRRYVDSGAVVRPGEPIAEIYDNNTYVLAYLPTGTLYDVPPDRKVTVSWGVKRTEGRIVAVDAVATQLPKEFQTAFSPVARNQILRIELLPREGESKPPLFTKVEIRGASLFGTFLDLIY